MKLRFSHLPIGEFPFLIRLLMVSCTPNASLGQISHGGVPYSFENPISALKPVVMAPVDATVLIAEDGAEEQMRTAGRQPYVGRFGTHLPVDLGLSTAGQWTDLTSGDRLWRLRISSPGAVSINLIFDDFYLPLGSTVYVYNQTHKEVLGSFTSENNKSYRRFSTTPIGGGDITVEFFEPATVRGEGHLHVSGVIHGYRRLYGKHKEYDNTLGKGSGYGHAFSCNKDVRCPVGIGWEDDWRAVAQVLLSDNTRICSGSLVNNEDEDRIPYFLTAHHCIDVNLDGSLSSEERNDAKDWIFQFRYESPSCGGPDGPTTYTISGAELLAWYDPSDFALLELSDDLPLSYKGYYAGWSRSESAATSVVGIDHPNHDVKKLHKDGAPTLVGNEWMVSDWTVGGTIVGSSGGPGLIRIIGSLVRITEAKAQHARLPKRLSMERFTSHGFGPALLIMSS